LNKDTTRFRMILQKGIKAEQFKQGATAHFTDKGLVIRVAKDSSASAAEMAPRGLRTVSATDLPAIDEASIEAELKSLAKSSSATASEAKKPASKVAKSEVDPKTASESEIPVLNSVPEKKAKSESVSGFRLILGLSIVGCFLLALWVASQRWLHKKNLKNAHTNIRVLTQHHMGPKKSLAIISVAGESILIGVTDHNISLIKTLSLLDEEIPQDLPQNFQQSLTTAENSNSDT